MGSFLGDVVADSGTDGMDLVLTLLDKLIGRFQPNVNTGVPKDVFSARTRANIQRVITITEKGDTGHRRKLDTV